MTMSERNGNTASAEANGGRTIKLVSLAALVLAAVLLPFVIPLDGSYFGYFMLMVFVYIVISQGWNLVAGYTGQVSLAQNAFFGLGTYTTGMIWIHDLTKTWYYFDPLVMILSGLVPVVLAVIVGIPLLSRLSGDYFAFGTLGLGMIINVMFIKGGSLTGGAMGISLPSEVFSGMKIYYWVGLLLAVIATLTVYLLTTSRIGLAFESIREDEISAASHGVPVLRYKVYAFAVGAFFAGIGGSLYAYYLFNISPGSVFNLNWLFYPILICVLGGSGTIVGPIIGSVLIAALFSFGDQYFGAYHPVFSGILIILIMKFLPGGLTSLWESKLRQRVSRRGGVVRGELRTEGD
jgi:branched-chain amino acid transport system permease protein